MPYYAGPDEKRCIALRQVELKHCRVAMLAALGFPIAEQSATALR